MRRLLGGLFVLVPLAIYVLAGDTEGQAPPPATATFEHGAVVSVSTPASEVGAAVLRDGGNAVDAAVATALALAVTWPEAGNLGGGGFMVIRPGDGAPVTTLDFRERAPAAATADMLLGEDGSRDGELALHSALAVGVPGSVAGLAAAHERYGSLPWARLVEPAARLARDGVVVDAALAHSFARSEERLLADPVTAALWAADGTLPVQGETWTQPELAGTLQRIAEHGGGEFYTGETARLLVAEFERRGGRITAQDLADYRAVERPPVTFGYRGDVVHAMGPPSSGGITMARILRIHEQFDVGALPWHGPDHLMLMAEACKRAYRDRNTLLGDPEHLPDMPLARLLGVRTARSDAAEIDLARATPSATWADLLPGEAEDTTHFSVVDGRGGAVSCTTTLNLNFGAKIGVAGAGFVLNDEMDDFVAKPGEPNAFGLVGNEANAIAPGKRPLSSMTPTVVERDGRVHLVVGAPGGSTIITSVTQVISNVTDHGMELPDAVAAPRVHHQWLPDVLYGEEGGWTADTAAELGRRGLATETRSYIGDVKAIRVHADGTIEAVSDGRRGGVPAGW